MIFRDVNHPCIFVWANGNEGGWNTAVDNRFADYDPQKRHVIHPWADFNGLIHVITLMVRITCIGWNAGIRFL